MWISLPDFEKACNSFVQAPLIPDEAFAISNWLERGGTIVFFPDIPKLADKIFLRPNLLADKIYEVLNNEVYDCKGEFSAEEIFKVKDKSFKTIFLEIAQHLKLIFPHAIKGKEIYFIAPQYLPDSHPIEDLFKIASKGAWQSSFWIKVPLFYYKKILHGLLLFYAADEKTDCRYFWKHGILFIRKETNEIEEEGLRVLLKGLYPNENEKDGVILIGVEEHAQKQQLIQKEIFNKILETLIARKGTEQTNQNKPSGTETIPFTDENGTIFRTESLYDNLEIDLQLSYDGINYIDYNTLKNCKQPKIKACNNNAWLITQRFSALLPFPPPKVKKVFLSYSHQNTAWLCRLRTHLAGLRRAKEIETWDDKEILPGDLWDTSIKKSLDEADVFILLLSADFIASEYIWKEELRTAFKKFKERKATVIPILFEPLDLGSIPDISSDNENKSFKISDFEIIPKNADERLQPVSLWQNKEEALAKVAERIRAVIKA